MNQKKMEIIKKRKKRLIWVFAITFVVIFVFFSWLASVMTPKMNNPVLDGEENDLEVNSSEFKGRIDSRLKFIELQDATPAQNTKQESVSTQENESLYSTNQPNTTTNVNNAQESAFKLQPAQPHENVDYNNNENYSDGTEQTEYQKPNPAFVKQAPVPPVPARPKTSKEKNIKVVVGNYGTRAEAEVAAQKLGATVLNDVPFIRQIDGRYTLQAGSFQDANSAMNLVQELEASNLYVKLIRE